MQDYLITFRLRNSHEPPGRCACRLGADGPFMLCSGPCLSADGHVLHGWSRAPAIHTRGGRLPRRECLNSCPPGLPSAGTHQRLPTALSDAPAEPTLRGPHRGILEPHQHASRLPRPVPQHPDRCDVVHTPRPMGPHLIRFHEAILPSCRRCGALTLGPAQRALPIY